MAYPAFVQEASDALRRVIVNESMIVLTDFNAHHENDTGVPSMRTMKMTLAAHRCHDHHF